MSERRWKWLLLVVLLGLHGVLGFFPQIMTGFGVGKSVVWFRDLHSMLAASDAAHEGLDPFVTNPYDAGGERHIYPDWWFALGRMGLTRADSLWLGLVTVALFWLAVFCVVRLRSSRDFWWTLAICASPPFWLAVNRANPDLLVFALLTLVVPMLHHRNAVVRALAPLPVALATGLKFFPALAGAVLLQPAPTRRENWQRWLLIAALLGLLAWSLADDVQRYLEAGWQARGLFTFGAAAVPLHYGGSTDFWVNAGRLAGILLVAVAIARKPAVAAAAEESDRRERDFFVMGAAVLAGGFFLTVGYLYKIVFAVWLLPVLLRFLAQPGAARIGFRVSLGCLVGMLWVEGLFCAALSCWPALAVGTERVAFHRTAATLSGVLAWGFVLPVVWEFGRELRRYALRWVELRRDGQTPAA